MRNVGSTVYGRSMGGVWAEYERSMDGRTVWYCSGAASLLISSTPTIVSVYD